MGGPWEKYQKQASTSPASSGDGPWNKYKKQGQTPPPSPQEPGIASQALDYGLKGIGYGLKGLGYAGGLARTGVAQAADAIQGNDKVGSADWDKALAGNAPSSADYMDRLGVPDGPSVPIPLTSKRISARDAAGFASDVALDPLTYASGGVSALEKLGAMKTAGALDHMANPAGKLLEMTGKGAYKSGFKKIDEGLIEKGIKPLSEVMLENGRPTGTVSKLSDAADSIAADKMAQRNSIYNQINNSGQKVDVLKSMNPALDKSQELLRKAPGADDQINLMNDWLLKYGKQGDQVPVDLASDWKSNLYNSLPSTAYDPAGRMMSAPKQIQQQFARGLKEGIVDAAERTEPGLGGQVGNINEDLGSILGSQKSLAREIRKGNTVNAVTPVDAALSVINPHAEVAKKLADLAKTTWVRTKAGNAMMSAGESKLTDPVLRNLLEKDSNNKDQQPSRWNLLGQ